MVSSPGDNRFYLPQVSVFAGAVALAALSAIALIATAPGRPLGPDFLVFWTGAHVASSQPAALYDPVAITHAQAWLLGDHSRTRPFVSPPSALLVFLLPAMLSYTAAFWAWTLLGVAFFSAALLRARVPLWALFFPPVALTLVAGQISLVVGALILLGLNEINRPRVSGFLFGLAACLKPQLLIFLPLALVSARSWTTIVATTATGMLVCALSVAVWGIGPWIAWIKALPEFHQLVSRDPTYLGSSITPYSQLARFGVDGRWAYLLLVAAVPALWLAFRPKQTSLGPRLVTLLGCAWLASPYALYYDLALVAPAMALMLVERRHPNRKALLAVTFGLASPILPVLALGLSFAPAVAALRPDNQLPVARSRVD